MSGTVLCLLSSVVACSKCAVAAYELANVRTCHDNSLTLMNFPYFSISHPQQTNSVITTVFKGY